MAAIAELRSAAALQSRLCSQNGSPTWAAVIDVIAHQLDDSHAPCTRLLLGDAKDPVESALYLRLLGAVHRLLLQGASSELAAFLPTLGGSSNPDAAALCFPEFVAAHEDAVMVAMQFPLQTNEVARSGVLSAGLRTIAAEVGLPIRLLEVGASAGLNLRLDDYLVRMGDEHWGPQASPVVLEQLLHSGQPRGIEFSILERAGCDPSPIDASSAEGQSRLRSFIWPEDVTRMTRLEAALSIFEPVHIDAAGATEWVLAECAELKDGCVTVVMHSIVMPYLTSDERGEFTNAMHSLGARATVEAPLAWLQMEFSEDYDTVSLDLDLWPANRHQVLATCTPHGARIDWLPVASPV